MAYSTMKKRNLVLINNATYQGETLLERPIRQPFKTLKHFIKLVLERDKLDNIDRLSN